MKLVITGARGFLGRAVVDAATAAGHDVTAMVRDDHRTANFGPSVRTLVGDLRAPGDWCATIGAAEVVVHAAASVGGPRGQQLANTVVATENLLAALEGSGISRFVLVSSFSVYDYSSPRRGGRLTEDSPLETRPLERDPYTEAKLLQEQLVRTWCADNSVPLVVLRPGAIAGPGRTWDFGAALTLGGFSLVIAPRARLRLISVENCADAIVRAVDAPAAADTTINLVDDEVPTHAELLRLARAAGVDVGRPVPVPWTVVSALGRALRTFDAVALGGRLKLPEVLEHRRQEARWKPLRYPNDRARELLGWRSEQSIEELVNEMAEHMRTEAHQ
jgi:2-alkyl-3-oxoalkanoate reductase